MELAEGPADRCACHSDVHIALRFTLLRFTGYRRRFGFAPAL
jgi:hypothetical protein